jgi:CheY-like chemotaxis protein
MALVAIAEPHDEIRELVARVVSALGHECVDARDDASSGERRADVLVFEPSHDEAFQLALRLRREQPGMPLIMISVFAPTKETRALNPVAFLSKPFSLMDVENAIGLAVHRPV